MNCARWRRWIALVLVGRAALAGAADARYLTGRVVDNAEILQPATRASLTNALEAHERATGNQVVVLTLPTLDGESIEGFATRVFESWQLGKKGKDNGVLLIVAPKDRRMRIEVGYGLEGVLPDVAASRIIRDVMTPAFKGGDYDRGIGEGTAAIVAALNGVAVPAAPASGGQSASLGEFGMDMELPPWPMRILLGAFIFGIIGLFTVIGVMTPGVGWFLYLFLIPFWAMFPIVVVGPRATLGLLALYVIGYPVAKLILARKPWYQKAANDLKTTGHANVGGFIVTGGSGGGSGSWSSGSGGGGGFSGGGGSSGAAAVRAAGNAPGAIRVAR